MSESSNADVPLHLRVMSLATTPQQAFERADCMLLEAAAVRVYAQDLETRARSLYATAKNMERSAYDLQRQGTEDRKEISELFDQKIQQRQHILPSFSARRPTVVSDLALEVEEGRILVEKVHAFGDRLDGWWTFYNKYKRVKSDPEPAAVPTSQTAEHSTTQSSMDTVPDEINTSTDSLDVAERERNQYTEPAAAFEYQFVVPDSDDDEYHTAETMLGTRHSNNAESEAPTGVIQPQRPPKAIRNQLNSDDEIPVSERKKKQSINREYRRKRMLVDMGYADAEISDVDLTKIEPSSGRKARGRTRKRNKTASRKRKNVETHASDDA